MLDIGSKPAYDVKHPLLPLGETMYEKRIARAYYRELAASLILYTILLVGSIKFGRPMNDGPLRTLVLLAPMIGFGLAIWAIARHLGRIDEYMRQYMLESVALAAAITAGLSFTYGFLETAGFPRLSMFTVWVVLCGSTAAVCAVRAIVKK
jgi:hypothetical protein